MRRVSAPVPQEQILRHRFGWEGFVWEGTLGAASWEKGDEMWQEEGQCEDVLSRSSLGQVGWLLRPPEEGTESLLAVSLPKGGGRIFHAAGGAAPHSPACQKDGSSVTVPGTQHFCWTL